MTPAQQAALELLNGDPLTPEQLAAIEPLLDADSRNDVAIAALLSAGKTRAVPTKIGVGAVLGYLYPDGGNFLNALIALGATDANAQWVVVLIKQGEFDVGLEMTRSILTQYAADHADIAVSINKLLALAVIDAPIHFNAVSDSLNVAEGRMTL